jgi:hypothetical protein
VVLCVVGAGLVANVQLATAYSSIFFFLFSIDAVWRIPGGVVYDGSGSGRQCTARIRLQLCTGRSGRHQPAGAFQI